MKSSRVITRRKWSVDKTNGPLVCLAEKLLKKLIQHGYGCTYIHEHDEITFAPIRGRTLGPDFWDMVRCCLRILATTDRIEYRLQYGRLYLVGSYEVLKDGRIRPCRSASILGTESSQ